MGIYRVNNKIYGIKMFKSIYTNYDNEEKVFEILNSVNAVNALNKANIQMAINFYNLLSKKEQDITSIMVYVEVSTTYESTKEKMLMWYSSNIEDLQKVFELY